MIPIADAPKTNFRPTLKEQKRKAIRIVNNTLCRKGRYDHYLKSYFYYTEIFAAYLDD
jgi:hypothetical protein